MLLSNETFVETIVHVDLGWFRWKRCLDPNLSRGSEAIIDTDARHAYLHRHTKFQYNMYLLYWNMQTYLHLCIYIYIYVIMQLSITSLPLHVCVSEWMNVKQTINIRIRVYTYDRPLNIHQSNLQLSVLRNSWNIGVRSLPIGKQTSYQFGGVHDMICGSMILSAFHPS